ncbi:MAG: helix-turn-helix transcriptional regulator, partial [Lachnospiraceae bacterium]|nr:helix-turn-helix transcriptional regulator [Lachnospiraceae bacterium]
MISYSGLLQKLNEKGLTKTALAKELGISSRTVAKIRRREKIADYVLEKMAVFFGCSVDELCQTISDNSLLQTLRDEKNIRMPGGLYHELQVRMTYNSNHIEGSKLS